MPIKRAAYKQLRSDKKKRFKNISAISAIKNMTKRLNKLISSKKSKDKLGPAFRDFSSLLNKAAQKGIIHKKTASRKTARISKKISQALSDKVPK